MIESHDRSRDHESRCPTDASRSGATGTASDVPAVERVPEPDRTPSMRVGLAKKENRLHTHAVRRVRGKNVLPERSLVGSKGPEASVAVRTTEPHTAEEVHTDEWTPEGRAPSRPTGRQNTRPEGVSQTQQTTVAPIRMATEQGGATVSEQFRHNVAQTPAVQHVWSR